MYVCIYKYTYTTDIYRVYRKRWQLSSALQHDERNERIKNHFRCIYAQWYKETKKQIYADMYIYICVCVCMIIQIRLHKLD